MNFSTKKWLFLKCSSFTLIPLMLWFIVILVSVYDSSHTSLVNVFSSKLYKFLFSLFVVNSFFFSSFTISEIFEDYIHNEKIKNVANKILFFFAIVLPIITILSIISLNI